MWRLVTTRDREEERVAMELKRAKLDSQRVLEQATEHHKSALDELNAVSSDRLRDLESELEGKDAAMKTMEMQLEQLHDLERQVKDKGAMLKSMEAQLKEHRRQKVRLMLGVHVNDCSYSSVDTITVVRAREGANSGGMDSRPRGILRASDHQGWVWRYGYSHATC
jgi:hypothetical protein